MNWTALELATSPKLSQAPELARCNPHGIPVVTEATARGFRSVARLLAAYLGDDREITAVTPQDVYQWQQHLARTVKPVTANSYLRKLRTMYRLLQKHSITGHDPTAPLSFLPEPPLEPKAVTAETYETLRAAADIRGRAILDLFWSSGCRLGELLSMRVATLELWEGGLAAPVVGKFGRSRFVYASGRSVLSVRAWLEVRPSQEGTDQLFTTLARKNGRGVGTALSKEGIHAMIRVLRKRAEIAEEEHCNPHSFRHSFAIRKLNQGYDLATVSQWLGHADPSFTAKVYAIRTEAELRQRYFNPPSL